MEIAIFLICDKTLLKNIFHKVSIFFFFQSNRENGKSIVPFNSRRNTKDYSSQLFLGSQWHVGGYMLVL